MQKAPEFVRLSGTAHDSSRPAGWLEIAKKTAILLVFVLAGCGGGQVDPVAERMVKAMAQAGESAPRAAPLSQAASPSASTQTAPTAEQLFDWAEYRYAQLFPAAMGSDNYPITYEGQPYTVRSWGNGNHLGLTPDGRIFGLGPFTGDVLMSFGHAADYAALVATDLCRVDPVPCFSAGAARTLSVSAGPGAEVRDATSGLNLKFPEGAQGQVTLTPLDRTPPPPVTDRGWRIEYTGSQRVEVVLEGAMDGSGPAPAAYVYEQLPPGDVDDGLGLGPRWIPLAVRQVSPGRWAFELWPPRTAAQASRSGAAATPAPNQPARHYYIGQFEKGTTASDKRIGLHGLAGVYMDDFIATLPPALASEVTARRKANFIAWGEDGSYYRGFTYQPNRRVYPIISITLDGFSMAHEVGHYLTHMLVGHDAYERLHNQPYPTEHGPGDVPGRGSINEDYAYFIESFLTGKGGLYDLSTASGTYLRGRPAGADVPAIEGFTAAMLAASVRTTRSIPSIDLVGRLVDVPVVGLSHGRVFELLSSGPQTVDAVRERLESGLDADGRRRLLVNLQRLGWRYHAGLRVVDVSGKPVANAPAKVLVRAGGTEYTSDIGTTDANGQLNLFFAFPGVSSIVVTQGGESLEGTITINSARSTQERQVLGDVVVQSQKTWGALREVCASFSYTTITLQSRVEDGPFTRVECVTMPSTTVLTWSGGVFSANAGTTYAEGVISPDGKWLSSLRALRPHTGRYKAEPPRFQILVDQMPRDTTSSRIRYRLEGAATVGKVQILYQPEDECFGSFCEARAVKAIDPASVSVWATFDE